MDTLLLNIGRSFKLGLTVKVTERLVSESGYHLFVKRYIHVSTAWSQSLRTASFQSWTICYRILASMKWQLTIKIRDKCHNIIRVMTTVTLMFILRSFTVIS